MPSSSPISSNVCSCQIFRTMTSRCSRGSVASPRIAARSAGLSPGDRSNQRRDSSSRVNRRPQAAAIIQRPVAKAPRPEALRPGVIQQHIVHGPPAQIGAALESLVGHVEIMSAEIIAIDRIARTRRRTIGIAAEAADGTTRRGGVDVVPASTRCDGEGFRNDIEVHRAKHRPLGVAARDVVEERCQCRGVYWGCALPRRAPERRWSSSRCPWPSNRAAGSCNASRCSLQPCSFPRKSRRCRAAAIRPEC